MKFAAWLTALFATVVGTVGLVSPDTVTMVRRHYLSLGGLLAIGTVRLAMGLALIKVAPTCRMPRALRALGIVMCVQGLSQAVVPPLLGMDRARAILEWETMHTGLLRVGALVALSAGIFVAFAVTARRPPEAGA